MKHPQTFQNRLRDKVTSDIANYTDQYYELAEHQPGHQEQEQELRYEYRDSMNAPTTKKTAWVFLLGLTLLIAIMDYSSISNFVKFLSISSGGLIGAIIKGVGWILFLGLELGVGYMLLQSKGKPGRRFFYILLAAVICFLPAYLIYTGYAISTHKTTLLWHRTMALMIMSIVCHVFFFIAIAEVWAAINYVIYGIRKLIRKYKDPNRKMKEVKKELQELYHDFDHHVIVNVAPQEVAGLLHNRAWHLKGKLQQGETHMDYDLSSYDPNISYAPNGTSTDNKISTDNNNDNTTK